MSLFRDQVERSMPQDLGEARASWDKPRVVSEEERANRDRSARYWAAREAASQAIAYAHDGERAHLWLFQDIPGLQAMDARKAAELEAAYAAIDAQFAAEDAVAH